MKCLIQAIAILVATLCLADVPPRVCHIGPPPAEIAGKDALESWPSVARPDNAGKPNDVGIEGEPQVQSEVLLTDGSTLHGTFRPRFVPAFSSILGPFRLDMSMVESIAFDQARAPSDSVPYVYVDSTEISTDKDEGRDCRIEFVGGDRLSAVLLPENGSLLLDTVIGPISIPIDKMTAIGMRRSDINAAGKGELLYHCTFDSPVSIKHPAVGPSGTFLSGSFVPGKVGNALRVQARTSAAEIRFPTGLMQPRGTIEFWAKIEEPPAFFPDGGNPQFFAMGVGQYVNTFVKFTANDGFGTGGLHADLPGSAYVSSLPTWGGTACYPEFLGDPSEWHHYALVWSEDGLDAASDALGRSVVSALYVDGRLMNPSYGLNGLDRAKFLRTFNEDPVVLAFPFVRDRQSPSQSSVGYIIDEFKIWSEPRESFEQ